MGVAHVCEHVVLGPWRTRDLGEDDAQDLVGQDVDRRDEGTELCAFRVDTVDGGFGEKQFLDHLERERTQLVHLFLGLDLPVESAVGGDQRAQRFVLRRGQS